MEAIKTLDRLVYNLTMGAGYQGYASLISAVELTDEELKKICQWSDERYQRVRIFDTEGLEALVTCWKPGQRGPIHNYDFQQGWIKILRGQLELEYFRAASGKPEAFNSMTIRKGEVTYLNDTLGYHRFSNTGQEACIALHFYSDKLKHWQVFDEETGRVEEQETLCDRCLDV